MSPQTDASYTRCGLTLKWSQPVIVIFFSLLGKPVIKNAACCFEGSIAFLMSANQKDEFCLKHSVAHK